MMDIPDYKLKTHEAYRICKVEEKLTSDFFSAHQHQYFEMIFFTESKSMKLEHSIDFNPYPIYKNRIFFIAKKQVHQWLMSHYTNEFKGYFIVFNESFIQLDKVLLDLFDFLDAEPYLDLDNTESNTALKLINLIKEHKPTVSKRYQQSLMEALLHFLVEKKNTLNIGMSINQKRFIYLRKLIEKHYVNEKQVSYYAKKMDISIKRLNEVIKEVSSLSITELIHQRILLQAKRELLLGEKSIQEIADTLGYHDASYFSRFFKKYVGLSPTKFMENNPNK